MDLSIRRRKTLAAQATKAGYLVERTKWANTQQAEFTVHVLGARFNTLLYQSGPHAEPGTACWVAITPHGVTIAAPGYRSGKLYQASLAGLERARCDILLSHVANAMRSGIQSISRLRDDAWLAATVRAVESATAMSAEQ